MIKTVVSCSDDSNVLCILKQNKGCQTIKMTSCDHEGMTPAISTCCKTLLFNLCVLSAEVESY